MKTAKVGKRDTGSRRSRRHQGSGSAARDDAKADPFAPREFHVDGESAIGEYARFAPGSIKEILYVERAKLQAEQLKQKYALPVPLRQRIIERDMPQAAPLSALVQFQAKTFNGLVERLKPRKKDVIIALDHVTDPRNLGAIIRSAAFFGVKEVLVPERRQVLLTQASVNTAQGGFALTDLVITVNLNRALSALKDEGYWIIGAAMGGEEFRTLASTYEKVVLVLGAEDTGLSKQVTDSCDRLAAIPSLGSGLESLNVSVAAGIFLCEFTRVGAATP
ncbi:MAG: RNA methyltransferase [Deltaproteobacteria bacterium]|nr:RNA methyltransferase [Deltaproteobacteria bacterium]